MNSSVLTRGLPGCLPGFLPEARAHTDFTRLFTKVLPGGIGLPGFLPGFLLLVFPGRHPAMDLPGFLPGVTIHFAITRILPGFLPGGARDTSVSTRGNGVTWILPGFLPWVFGILRKSDCIVHRL